MRQMAALASIAVKAAVAGLALGACTGSPSTVSTSSSTPGGAKTAAPAFKGASQGHVGATLTLTDNQGNKLNVTAIKVLQPAPSVPIAQDVLQANQTPVSVQFRVQNPSTRTVDLNAFAEAKVIDSANQSYDPVFGLDTSGGQAFQSGGSIGPGETLVGYIGFGITEGQTVTKIKWTSSSGFASDTGLWLIP